MTDELFKLAAIQAAAIPFDRDASTDKACRLIREAGGMGATIAGFGETWLPGYPFFCNAGTSPLTWRAMAEYLRNAVEIPSRTTDRLCEAAKDAGIDVVIGVAERDAETGGTVYCTLLFIGKEGRILGRHRKIKPTFNERSVWGEGDAVGLRVYERPYGRISGLNCWEHNTMLPGYALAAQGTQIHVAAWPGREPASPPPSPTPLWPRQLLLSRAFASQVGCYVIAVGGMRSHSDTPERYRELSTIEHTGDSCIIDPRGEIVAGPAVGETILIAEGSREVMLAAKTVSDIAGHYSRPDLLRLIVDRNPQHRIVGENWQPC
ncbi:MAG: carbon-nitrogen hydrolase family protein [Alphaproteobacteria bacterium]|nr:MAG: carbon-nitrogen hydrolase family protein [Alphaproteobacteria bacterium]